MLLAVRDYMVAQGEPFASVDEILAATGANAAEAHALKETLHEVVREDQAAWQAAAAAVQEQEPGLAEIYRLYGPDEAHQARLHGLLIEVLRFAKQHPGCVSEHGDRQRYSESFRQFVLQLRHRHVDVAIAEFAMAIDVPLGTLEDWLRGGHHGVGPTAHAQLRRASRRVRARKA